MSFKDHFSTQSRAYAHFRPQYPPELFAWLATVTPTRKLAWDCATGNGQAAHALAEHFERVEATDASAQQIAQVAAGRGSNVQRGLSFRTAAAEASGLAAHSVDLITVAQALHWFDLDGFYREVSRVLRPGGVLAVWSYGLAAIAPQVDAVVAELYRDVLDGYWPQERRLVESGYRGLTLPFPELEAPVFGMGAQWDIDHLLGYLGSWSAVQRYRDARGEDPLGMVADGLARAWGDGDRSRRVRWPLALRVAVRP